MSIERYYLGCAMWGLKEWSGEFFDPQTPSSEFLAEYASVFNAVEGNTTFYGVPDRRSIERWREATPESFHFCFKFPRRISHELRLVGAGTEVRTFLDAVAPLGSRLGPFFLQLPPDFDATGLDVLAAFLRALPQTLNYAVEVRHRSFFGGDEQRRLVDLLRSMGIDRVVLDARVLHHTESDDTWISESKRRKPNLPVRRDATGSQPFVRLMGNDVVDDLATCIDSWATVAHEWLEQGRTPHMFLHSPNDFWSPRLCRMFHERVATRTWVGQLPAWPITRPPQLRLV